MWFHQKIQNSVSSPCSYYSKITFVRLMFHLQSLERVFSQAFWNRSFIKCSRVIPCHILKPALEFASSFVLYNSVMLVAYLKSRIVTLQVMFEMNRRTRPDDFISKLYTSLGRRLPELAYKLLGAGHTSLSTLAECGQTVGS